MFSRLTSFFPFSIEFLKNYKKLPMPPTPTPPHQLPYTLTRTTVRCPLIRERDVTLGGGVRWGGGGGGKLGVSPNKREGGTSWLGGTWGDGGT